MEKTKRLSLYFFIGILVMMMLASFEKPVEANSQRDLVIGKIGGDVRQLQVDLNKKGYRLEPFDGIYGLRTWYAVIDVQKKNNLKQTGIFDGKTRKALYDDNKKDKKDNQIENQNRQIKDVSRGASRKDVMMLARVIHGEARGESFEGQVAVAAVILNRTQSGRFPHTVNGVVFEPGAFDAVSDGQIWLDPDAKSVKAAELAMSGYDPTGEAIYYWNPATATSRWVWSRPIITRIGEHVFAK